MGGLLEGIESQKPQGNGQRALRRFRTLDVDELGERLEHQLPQAFPLPCEPLFEGGWMRPLGGQALEEVAMIQDRRPFKVGRRALSHQLLEDEGINLDPGRIQDQGVPVNPQA